jgi:hypothetical protein
MTRAHRIGWRALPAAMILAACAIPGSELEVGDCFNTDASGSEVTGTSRVDCGQPHVYEAYAIVQHSGSGDFPGDTEMQAFAESECLPAFEAYVGMAYQSSEWYSTNITPTADTWSIGDREIICALHNEAETEVTGSARNSNR